MEWLARIAILVAFIAFFFWTVWPMHVRRRRQVQRAQDVFSGREPLVPDEFAGEFYPDIDANVPIELRRLLENELGFDLARLRPGDRLVADLGFATVDGLAPMHFAHDIEESFGISFPSHAWSGIDTFSDLVTQVANQNGSSSVS